MSRISRRPNLFSNFARERKGTACFEDDLTVDVVLVSSVGADPVATWGSWVEEDLLAQIPTAYIRFYDHGLANDDEGLEALGDRFLRLLQQKTHKLELRPPLILLCHGSGGLVVKTALVNAHQNQRYLGIVQSCIGISFFSVPQHGSTFLSDPDFYQSAVQIPNTRWEHDDRQRKQNKARIYLACPPETLIEDLSSAINLESLSEAFSSLLETTLKNTKVWSLYETVSGGFRWTSREAKVDDQQNCVVRAESATFGISERGTNVMLLCDHWGTASFDTMHPKDVKFDSLHASTSKADFVSEVQGCVFGELWPFGDITQKFKAQSHCFYKQYPYHISNDMSFAELLEGEMKTFLYPDDTISIPNTYEPNFVPIASKDTKIPRSVLKKPNHVNESPTSYHSNKSVSNLEISKRPANQRTVSQGDNSKAVLLQTGDGVVKPKDSYHNAGLFSVMSENGSFIGRRSSLPIHEKSAAPINSTARKLAFSRTGQISPTANESNSPRNENFGGSKPRCRWIHIPCTHTGWAEEIIRGFAAATNQEKQCEEMLQDKFWLKRQNSVTHNLPHARYMHSMCEFFGSIPDSQAFMKTDSKQDSRREPSPHPTNRSKYSGVREVMYIPYLHWEPFRQFRRRERVIHNCIKLEMTPDQQSTEEESRTFAAQGGLKRRKAEGTLLANFKLFSKLKENLSESPGLRLIWQCLSEDKQLHCRRSLDQYMYTTLPDTSVRDRDQILYKSRQLNSGYTTSLLEEDEDDDVQPRGWENDESDEEDGTPGNVLVVDQLWMFVMDDDTVITFFPPKEVDIKPKPGGRPIMYSSALKPEAPPGITPLLRSKGDIQTAILKDLETKAEMITDKWDLAALVVKHAVTVLFDRFETKEPHVMTHFGRYIERLTESQARSWSRLKFGRGRRVRGSSRDVQQIFQDIRDLRELRDVEDELGIIKKILDKQQTHVGKMQKEYGERVHLAEGNGVWYLDEAVNMIDRQHEQITRMLENLQVTIKGYDDLISLQQNQIALYEAIDAGEQSRAVTIFTVFTVFFLPLSFFTSLYGMNIQEWSGESQNISMNFMLSTTLPISFCVIAIAFLFANDSRARSSFVEAYQVTVEFFIIIAETFLRIFHLPTLARGINNLWKRFKHTYFTPLKISLKKHRTLRIREKRERREMSRFEVKRLGLEEKFPKAGRGHRSPRSAELVEGDLRKRRSLGRGERGQLEVERTRGE
ncbi:hypothetical protein HYFRA_00012073 [Hymenoscyphus fraxineus]|uniref:DUF676 domain-containing protein n=1 Tax=Hymenoscyphus fraxineus TaxID=746836 RepID=A0A9N9KY91_9HELO|nr:hypothetical protein HYFRA_00012073 [Hymenoscyphus fraxineus]